MTILVGMRFGRLVVLRHIEGLKIRDIREKVWECKCDCGVIKNVRTGLLTKGCTRSCGCSRREPRPKRRKGFGEASRNALVWQYKRHGKRKNLAFSLTDEEMNVFFKGKCFYCGESPNTIFNQPSFFGGFKYNGIDRLDNDKGYSLENCVSCCKTCNLKKRNMSKQDFLNKIKQIYDYKSL